MSSAKQTIQDIQNQVVSMQKNNQSTVLLNSPKIKLFTLSQIQAQPNSQTEKQLFSRKLIKEIICKGRAKTVRHQIGIIDKKTCLYAKPTTNTFNSVTFQRAPPHNKGQLFQGLTKNNQTNIALRTKSLTISTKNQYSRNGLKSESYKKQMDLRNKRVTVSGLVTYKFSSVNAERSIASNIINYEQKLKSDIKLVNQGRDCNYNRFKKILLKQSTRRYKEQCRKQKKIVQNMDLSIDSYLQRIEQENQGQMVIYRQKIKNISFIKKFMKDEKTNYSEGKLAMQSIEVFDDIHKNKKKQARRIKTQSNQDVVFGRRKTPKLNKDIKVKYLTFVQ